MPVPPGSQQSNKGSSKRSNRRGFSEHLILLLICIMTVVILHVPLLELPFFWDEAGYYIPAALELSQHGRLIPQTTAANPHPPLLSIYLAAAYKLFGTSP